MPADDELDQLDRWLKQQVQPLPPPSGTFALIAKRARRRRIRKALVSVAGAAAVAAAVGVAVPVSMSLHLSTSSTNGNLSADGQSAKPATPSQSSLGNGTRLPSSSASSAEASAAAGGAGSARASASGPNSLGWLPPNLTPSSVTWDSLSTGWVVGPAGTPGRCGANANSTICTSIAVTHDAGQTWSGVPAPVSSNITGIRFLNATYGWAYGFGLWATDDGGKHWHQVNTGGLAVTDLETVNGRAYALFGRCTQLTDGNYRVSCTSFTLKTAAVGSDGWTPVGGVPASLSAASTGTGAGQQASAAIELGSAAGYLVAPDGTLYTGPLDGTAWHAAAKLPCSTGPANGDGQPLGLLLAPVGTTSGNTSRLAMVCGQAATGPTSVYQSADNGSTWTGQTAAGSLPSKTQPESLTTRPDGTLIVAATAGSPGTPSGGIYRLVPGATQWQAASLSDPSGKTYGFTYVGMTSATQGVALGGNPSLHAIWMTTDGGQTWQVRPIQS